MATKRTMTQEEIERTKRIMKPIWRAADAHASAGLLAELSCESKEETAAADIVPPPDGNKEEPNP